MNQNDKQDKKGPVKRVQMSGLQALRQNLGVGTKEVEPVIQEVVPTPIIKQPEKIDNQIDNTPESNTIENVEKETLNKPTVPDEAINVIPETKPKEKSVNDGSKKPLSNFFVKSDVKSKKETVNITTAKRDALKLLAVLEKSTINDLMENMIDWFFESYNEEIIKKPGMKDLMKEFMKNNKK